MPFIIDLPDGTYHKRVVSGFPFSGWNEQQYEICLLSGTVKNSMLKGYCEILGLGQQTKKVVCFFGEGDGAGIGYGIHFTNRFENYNIVFDGTEFIYQHERFCKILVINVGIRKVVFETVNGQIIRKTVSNANVEESKIEFGGTDQWFDSIIDTSHWNWLKNPTLIGKTERVPEDPFYQNVPEIHLPFQAQNTAPVENAPAGIE